MLEDSRAFSFTKHHLLCQPQFLLPWQALELTFCAQCLSFAIERPGSDKSNRSMGSGVVSPLSSIVESNAPFDVGGVASIERPISAADHVDIMRLRMIHIPPGPFALCLCHRPFLVSLHWCG